MKNVNAEIENWIRVAKGGPGSGDTPGHAFNGNQYTDASGAIDEVTKLSEISRTLDATLSGLKTGLYPMASWGQPISESGSFWNQPPGKFVDAKTLQEKSQELEDYADKVKNLSAAVKRSSAVVSGAKLPTGWLEEYSLSNDAVGKHFLEASKYLSSIEDNLRGAASILKESAARSTSVKPRAKIASDGWPSLFDPQTPFKGIEPEKVLSRGLSSYTGNPEHDFASQVKVISGLFAKSELSLYRAALAMAKDPSKEPTEEKATADSAKYEAKATKSLASADAMDEDIESKYDAATDFNGADEDGRPLAAANNADEIEAYQEAKDAQDGILHQAATQAAMASNAYSVMAHFASQRGDKEAAEKAQEKAKEMDRLSRKSTQRWMDAMSIDGDVDY